MQNYRVNADPRMQHGADVMVAGKTTAARPDIAEEEEHVIGVKVLTNAPDPRFANKNLGKSNLFFLSPKPCLTKTFF